MVLFFNELETKSVNYALGVVLFFNELETKSVNYALKPAPTKHDIHRLVGFCHFIKS